MNNPLLRKPTLGAIGTVAVFAVLVSCSSHVAGQGTRDDAGDIATDAAKDGGAPHPGDGDAEAGASDAAADAAGEADALDTDAPLEAAATFLNPVLDQDFPDPFILRQGSTYYAFGTNSGTANVRLARSTDLADWTLLPDALPVLPSWATAGAGLTWAPSILQLGSSSFVMYYTARDTASGFQCVSHAESSSPEGPYVDSTSSAFVCQVSGAQSLCGSIDPSPLVDTDGTAYLVWKSDENSPSCLDPPRLWSAPLAADGLALAGSPTQLLVMDEAWQQSVIEGPSMTVVGGVYYLLYSANDYESAAYAMGYATCLSPSGPCENVSVTAPFISSAGSALGPGGGEFLEDAVGGRWLVYHAWTAPKTTYAGGGARSMRIDRLDVDSGAGTLSFAGPTTSLQPL